MKKIIYILIVLFAVSSLQSCSKEEEVNIGSVVFWMDEETAEYYTYLGSTSLNYYIDDQFSGSSALVYFNNAPNCGQNAATTIKKDLGTLKSKGFFFKVTNQNGEELWEGVVNLETNVCLKKQLI
jgi:hypothetical protein